MHFGELCHRVGIYGDTSTGSDANSRGVDDERTDDHRELCGTVIAEVSKRTRIDASLATLELGKYPHRADFGSARHRARGEARLHGIERGALRLQLHAHGAHQLVHVGVGLHGEQ